MNDKTISVDYVEKLSVKEGESLVVTVDCGKLPRAKAEKYMGRVMDMFRKGLDDSIPVYVIPKELTLQVVSAEEKPD